MTTLDSPRGLLMIGLSFWTGLFMAYVLCTTGLVHVAFTPLHKLAAIAAAAPSPIAEP